MRSISGLINFWLKLLKIIWSQMIYWKSSVMCTKRCKESYQGKASLHPLKLLRWGSNSSKDPFQTNFLLELSGEALLKRTFYPILIHSHRYQGSQYLRSLVIKTMMLADQQQLSRSKKSRVKSLPDKHRGSIIHQNWAICKPVPKQIRLDKVLLYRHRAMDRTIF